MNHPGRERRRRREQLRRARRKLDERQMTAEGRAGDGNRESEREWRDLVEAASRTRWRPGPSTICQVKANA